MSTEYQGVTAIGSQNFLNELKSLLGSMDEDTRTSILEAFAARFEAAEDEDKLIRELGSPLKVAVQLSRKYAAGELPKGGYIKPAENRVDPEPPKPEQPSDETITADPETERPSDEAIADEPEQPSAESPVPKEQAEECQPVEEDKPLDTESLTENEPETEPVYAPETVSEELAEEPEPVQEKQIKLERRGAFVPAVILAILLGTPVTLIFAAISCAFILAGLFLLITGGATLYFAFGLMVMFADVMLLAGVAAIMLSIGLLLAWFGIWLFKVSVINFVCFVLNTVRRVGYREVTEK